MPSVLDILKPPFTSAIAAAFGGDHAGVDPLIRPSTNLRFGDFQANVAMSLAKPLGRNPRDVAQQIVDRLELAGICEDVTIAGPGFINLTLSRGFLDQQLAAMAGDGRLGVAQVSDPQTVVVDYSGPNVAKEMHVGHLRSTVIGDTIARVLAFQGHQVIRQNHLGDWGTQFGMLIEHLIETFSQDHLTAEDCSIGDLNTFYQEAKQKFDADPDFAQRSRQRVVKLQSGDAESNQLWESLRIESMEHFDGVYDRLDVLLTDDDVTPESFYNQNLPSVIEDLQNIGLLRESQGAGVVYPDGFKDREGQPMAMIVRKSDGGYLYATTDLAAARYRIDKLGADRVIYVTDARQGQHFAMVFAVLRQGGWADGSIRLDHVPFGAVLGPDRKPFKTREGGTVKLIDLIDEAERRAAAVITDKNPSLPENERGRVAHAVGIGALKYADLSSDRIKDYVFDWDRMLAFEGNTAPYLQNAYVRIRSIFRKGGVDPQAGTGAIGPVSIHADGERALAVKLLQLPGVIDTVGDSLEPHRLCTYLYELASGFHQFYERCPVLKAADEAKVRSRLGLCSVVARTLKLGMGLLGIEVPQRM